MLGAAEDIVRRGGQRGIGCTMISQRSAVLNKNVLTQIEVLIALRTISPQDLKAIDAWVDVHGSDEERKTLKESLPSLPTGDAWVWSPGWPTTKGIFKRVHVGAIKTFDSGASPKPGEKRVEPKAVAQVDLEAVRTQMAEVVERAAASDPKALRARIRELEKEIALKQPPPAISDSDLEAIQEEARAVAQARADETIQKALAQAREIVYGVTSAIEALEGIRTVTLSLQDASADVQIPVITRPVKPPLPIRAPSPARRKASTPVEGVDGPMQRILDAIAWYESGAIPGPYTKNQVAFVAKYKPGGGSFQNALGRLRSAGLIEYPSPGFVTLTEDGRGAAAWTDEVLTPEAIQTRVLAMIDGPMRRILEPLIQIYPDETSKDDLAELAGYTAGGGSYQNALGRLRSLGVIDYPSPGMVVALEVLFP